MRQHRVARLVLAGLLLGSVACSVPPSSGSPTSAAATRPAAPSAEPIKLGVLADLSGPFAPQGAQLRINTDLAVQQWNESGGVDGRPVQALYVDPKSDPAQALQAATQFVQRDRVDVLVGGVGSNECAAVQELAAKVQVLYLTSSGCAAEEITSKSCNMYTFRFVPQGRQAMEPLTRHLVERYGPNWGLMYPDYAFGQSTLASFGAGLKEAGGKLAATLPVPLGETNLTPFVTKVPTDGSIVGLYDSLTGTQSVNSITALQQYGIASKLTLVISGGKDGFGGVYPDVVNGALFNSFSPDDPQNPYMQAYIKNFRQMAKIDADVAQIIGGPDNAHPGSQMGISAYVPIVVLKDTMRAIHYSGPSDTPKLIDALAHFKAQQSMDFPGGDVIMDPVSHQGRMTLYVSQIEGQQEKVLFATTADQMPPIGDCKVAA
jgi:branched-chain amino acid transport system substrate-binding protein